MVSDIHLIAIRFGTLFINLYFKIQMHVLIHASILDKKKERKENFTMVPIAVYSFSFYVFKKITSQNDKMLLGHYQKDKIESQNIFITLK